ncbi:MAG: hypothetical protein K9J13_15045 [Saprospiraceae bacterium]|nr:hypothetical protein [Saprospiraceae bacterium]
MSKAFLITGFSNWGKTYVIQEIFQQKRFFTGITYPIHKDNPELNFVVVQNSNDDYKEEKEYIGSIISKYGELKPEENNLIAAFCPTIELGNDSKIILNSDLFSKFDEIVLLCLVDKWDLHARLNMKNIKEYFNSIDKVKCIGIETDKIPELDDRLEFKKTEIIKNIIGLL